MKLNIITPFQKISKEVDWVEIDTKNGNFVILDNHAPTILDLQNNSNIIYGLKTGKQESHLIKRAIVHVKRDSINFLGEV